MNSTTSPHPLGRTASLPYEDTAVGSQQLMSHADKHNAAESLTSDEQIPLCDVIPALIAQA